MPSLDSYLAKPKSEQKFLGLFVGRSGDGKSVAAASFPRPMMILDFDFRISGIEGGVSSKCLENTSGIEYEQFNARTAAGYTKFDNLLVTWETMRQAGTFPYKTIVIDSMFSMSRVFLAQAHAVLKGKFIGSLRMSGPGDYGFEVSATHQVFDFLRMLQCNVICSAHTIDKYGKIDPNDPYSSNEVKGEKLTVRDQLGESVQAYFDNVFRFSRDQGNNKLYYRVEFATDLAKNSYGIGPGQHDVTNKNFHNYLTSLITPTTQPIQLVK